MYQYVKFVNKREFSITTVCYNSFLLCRSTWQCMHTQSSSQINCNKNYELGMCYETIVHCTVIYVIDYSLSALTVVLLQGYICCPFKLHAFSIFHC